MVVEYSFDNRHHEVEAQMERTNQREPPNQEASAVGRNICECERYGAHVGTKKKKIPKPGFQFSPGDYVYAN